MIPFMFRVHRTVVAGETVSVMLEPFAMDDTFHPNEGDEFITGALAVDPYGRDLKRKR